MSQENGIEIIKPDDKVSVLLPLVFRKAFDYRVPEGMEVKPGDYVRVPFGKKSLWGVVWGKAQGDIEENKIKSVEEFCAYLPGMSESMRKFIDWVAWYTLAPAGMVLKMALSAPEALETPVASCKLQVASNVNAIKLTPSRLRILTYLSDGIPRSIKEITEHAKVSANVVQGFLKAGGLKEVRHIAHRPACGLQPAFAEIPADGPATCSLSPEQKKSATAIHEKLSAGFSVTLLDGVTGSGKTEVYFDAIGRCIRQGRQVLVLLPEIVLSVQWLDRFKQRFGFAPDIWHSSVTSARKHACWRGVAEGSARVVVGARSALFLPFRELGLVVADEEHDASYKQEEGVVYQARDMAVARARHEGVPALLVSATPSLETEFNIGHGRYQRLHLPNRHNDASLPEIELVDMRKQATARNRWISEPLKNALINTLSHKNQAMIFMNRRGYAPLVLCRACGHRFQCPHCTAWLVLHRSKGKLLCHHCGHVAPLPKACPECKTEGSLIPYGPGVERIAEELREMFPDARIAVMTSDSVMGSPLPPVSLRETPPAGAAYSTPSRTHASDVIGAMGTGDIDILVGTQMIAKGHHFAGLALVGVVDADMGLGGGDLRAGERTYQLLHQLAGRAGREKTRGMVYLQTYMPEHPVMQALAASNRDGFMLLEARMREEAGMPPYGKLAAVIIEGQNEQEVIRFARELVKVAGCRSQVAGKERDLQFATCNILGPAPAPLARLKNRFRYRILVKAARSFNMQQFLAGWLLAMKIPASLKVKVDVDPYSFV